MLRISVVLPDPKNPVITVAGIRLEIAETAIMWFSLSIYAQVNWRRAEHPFETENEKGRAIDPALTPPKRSDLHPGKDHAFDIFDQIGKTNASNKRASKARLQRINTCHLPDLAGQNANANGNQQLCHTKTGQIGK